MKGFILNWLRRFSACNSKFKILHFSTRTSYAELFFQTRTSLAISFLRGLRTRFYFFRELHTRIYFLGAPFGATRTPNAGRDRDAAKQHKKPRSAARRSYKYSVCVSPCLRQTVCVSPCSQIILHSSFFILHLFHQSLNNSSPMRAPMPSNLPLRVAQNTPMEKTRLVKPYPNSV